MTTFLNLLPVPISVVLVKYEGINKIKNVLCYLDKHEKKYVDVFLKKDDEIHTLFSPISIFNSPIFAMTPSSLLEILRPIFIRNDNPSVLKFGDVTYDEKYTNYFNSHADISGIRFHNHTLFPLGIYFQGAKIAACDIDNNTDFMNGSRNSVYVDNNRRGFRLGDAIELNFIFSQKTNNGLMFKEIPYTTLYLNDNYTKNIFVGDVNSITVSNEIITNEVPQNINQEIQRQYASTSSQITPPDTFAYGVSVPSYTGITYYNQSQNIKAPYWGNNYIPDIQLGYNTTKSNLFAPF